MVHTTELTVFIVLSLAVTMIGFGAGRWRRAKLDHLDEWGLGGRKFGSVITWFLLGGDLYTAYTFVAVPAAVFATGAAGLFAIPYTIIVFPIVFVVMPKLWQVSRNRGYVTASDYVKERFDSRLLALAIALTGIVATMPYIALQIFGIQVVIAQMGVNVDLALVIAFVVLALFTYVSGLRAPALIAIVKDALIGITVLVLVIYIPSKLGGYGAIFDKVAQVQAHQKVKPPATPVNYLSIGRAQYAAYASLAFGSALALFLYPHAITGTLAARGQRVIRRNAVYLIPYSFMLGLIALLGYMAIAAGTKPLKASGNNGIVPALLDNMLPGWFAGFAFAAIAIGALVPASVMSIAAANLFSRNVYKEFIVPGATHAQQATASKVMSLLVKFGALAFILWVDKQNVINFQLAGGVLILQTLPAVILALYVPVLNRWAVLLGWAAGITTGVYWLGVEKFKVTTHGFPIAGPSNKLYIGLVAFGVNLGVVVVGSLLAYALGARRQTGTLTEADYQPVAVG
ncbi:MAG TPA: sodium:solute symporter [Candidatus Dormibacteraeota bacterium]|jgi:SSS family solute:Na+ symporter|nr:sodium:solute symporter [Candidatus Dormibacteraeota bacterium]